MSVEPRIVRLAETASTNTDAMRLALQGEALPLWVVADRQTAGRGRAGRSWIAFQGNFYASSAFTCDAPPEKAGQISLVAGISLFDAVAATTALAQTSGLRLKWPNDLLVGISKVGGILIETTPAPGKAGFISVAGFGINIAGEPQGLDRSATSLARTGVPPDRDALLDALAHEFCSWLGVWDEGRGFETIRSEWMRRAGPVGEPISVNTAAGPVAGIYRGLSDTGALQALIDGALRDVTYGDVALAAEVPAPDGHP